MGTADYSYLRRGGLTVSERCGTCVAAPEWVPWLRRTFLAVLRKLDEIETYRRQQQGRHWLMTATQ